MLKYSDSIENFVSFSDSMEVVMLQQTKFMNKIHVFRSKCCLLHHFSYVIKHHFSLYWFGHFYSLSYSVQTIILQTISKIFHTHLVIFFKLLSQLRIFNFDSLLNTLDHSLNQCFIYYYWLLFLLFFFEQLDG